MEQSEAQKKAQPPKKQNKLDNISKEDLARVERAKASTQGHLKVDSEWLLITEFALKFGWEAYRDVKADRINMDEMLTLIEASRRLDSYSLYRDAQAAYIGAGSAQTKKPSNTFKQLTSRIIKGMKADN